MGLRNFSSRIFKLHTNFCTRDPEWADVKLAQAKYLLSRLAQFKTLVSDKYECIPEVIVAGDFNSQPGDMVPSISKILSISYFIN
jgi:CCR4-NOT transcription complex subunit 6